MSEQAYIPYKQYRLHYQHAGASGSAMVFLHNGNSDSEIWQKQIPHFAKKHHVFALDFLGNGKSDRPNQTLPLESHLNQLEVFLNTLNLEKVILVGNCVGASTAIEYSQRYPERVIALVASNICGGRLFVPPAHLFPIPSFLAGPLIWFLSLPGILSPQNFFGKPRDASDPLWQHYIQKVFTHPLYAQTRKNLFVSVHTFEKFAKPLHLVSNFPRSILFWGAKNRIVPARLAAFCQKNIRAEEVHILEDAGHLCFYENAEEYNFRIDEFLQKLNLSRV